MEEDELTGEIEFPVDSMKKESDTECARMIWGGVGIFLAVAVLGYVLNFLNDYMIALMIISPLMAVVGFFCWLTSLYNETRALRTVKATEDGFEINDDHFAFEGLNMNFVHGKCLGKVRNFNSLYLQVRAKGFERRYWMGLYRDRTAYILRDRLGKLIDRYEFDEALINKG